MKVKVACEKCQVWLDLVDDCGRFKCDKCNFMVQVEIPID